MKYFVICLTLLVISTCVLAKRRPKRVSIKNCKNLVCSKDVVKPVCGIDGVTYNNKCELKLKTCASGDKKQAFIKHEGNCSNRKKKSKKRAYKKCPASFSRCKTLNTTRNSVCGSDNVTYHTYCHFRIAKCRSELVGEPISLLYRGVCGKPRVKLVCPLVTQCPNRNSPICGEDGKTYRNLCFFLIAKCEARKKKQKLKLLYRGSCGSPVTPKPCPTSCPTLYKPVCGTDGKTYQNGCLMAQTKCRLPKGMKRHLRVKYRGACGKPLRAKPCLTRRKCRRKRGSPVCGTDGVTYRSKCHLRVVKCQAKRNKRSPIVLKHMGRCRHITNLGGL